MTTWYRLDLGNGQDAFKPTAQILEAFEAALLVAPRGTEIAVFSNYDLEADNVQVFFTPEASRLAMAFHATPCSKPVPGRYKIGLLAGNFDALSRHFPNQPPK